jgi:TolB-like protein
MGYRLPRSSTVLLSATLAALASVGAMIGAPAPARAADNEAGIAVLGIEALDGQDNAVANDVTEALRQRVVTTKAGSAQLQGKDLVELKLIFSCPDEAIACLAQAGKSLGASELLFGNIKRSSGDLILTLKLIDANRGTLEGSTVETLPKRKADTATLRALAATWLGKLSKNAGVVVVGGATLIIRSNVAGATITLDGTEAGITTKKGLTLSDVSPGKHEIAADKAGYGRITQQFSIGPSQALPLTLALQTDGTEIADADHEGAGRALPPMRDEPPSDDSSLRSWMRTSFWVALGATAVSLGLATKYGLDVRSINSDLDMYRNNKTAIDAAGDTVKNKLADGNRAETRQWIFVGVGSAFAVASGFLFYKGYLDKEAGTGTRTSDNHGLRIFPTANAASGGIAAEFDF